MSASLNGPLSNLTQIATIDLWVSSRSFTFYVCTLGALVEHFGHDMCTCVHLLGQTCHFPSMRQMGLREHPWSQLAECSAEVLYDACCFVMFVYGLTFCSLKVERQKSNNS